MEICTVLYLQPFNFVQRAPVHSQNGKYILLNISIMKHSHPKNEYEYYCPRTLQLKQIYSSSTNQCESSKLLEVHAHGKIKWGMGKAYVALSEN